MILSPLRKVALFACLCFSSTALLANALLEYQVYEKDIDSDGDIDYLLKLAPENVEIPYDINLQIERDAQQYLLTRQADGSFVVSQTTQDTTSWSLIEADIDEINYLAGDELEIAIRTQGDSPSAVVLSQDSQGTLLSTSSLAAQLLENGALTSILDLNADGEEELVVSGSGTSTLSSAGADLTSDSVQNLSFNTWVGADGSANASLPIWLPKGPGPTPQINISYNSNLGNGPLGLGASLSGSSKIHYCPPTADVKGTMAATPFSAEEDLCLDGQHLVLVGGTHTSVGAKYVLENNAQIKISKTSDGFEALMKTGGKRFYHLNRSSKQWYLTRVEDEFSNGYELDYKYYGTEISSNQTPLLETITYDDTGVIVDLVWQARTANDVLVNHKGGQASILSDRLSSISIKRDSSNLKSYVFSYVLNDDGRSLLNKVAMCEAGVTCGVATCDESAACVSASTNWNTGVKIFSSPSAIGSFPNKDPDQKAQYLDINGDGYLDIMYPAKNAGSWRYHLGTKSGFGPMKDTYISTGSGSYASYARPISLGADHMSGLIVAKTSITNEETGDGASWVCADKDGLDEDEFVLYKDYEHMKDFSYHKDFQDINAHWCKPDSMYPDSSLKGPVDPGGRVKLMGMTQFYLMLPNIDSSGTILGFDQIGDVNNKPLATTVTNAIEVADINGDGLQDIIIPLETQFKFVDGNTKRMTIQFSRIIPEENGTTVEFTGHAISNYLGFQKDSEYSPIRLIDFNGDGIVDFESCPANNFSVNCTRAILDIDQSDGVVTGVSTTFEAVSNPTRLTKNLGEGSDAKIFSSPKYYQDFNGDGLQDLLWVASDGLYMQLNTGLTLYSSEKVMSVMPDDSFGLQFFDYNADGLMDVSFSVSGKLKRFIASQSYVENEEEPGKVIFSYIEGVLDSSTVSNVFKGVHFGFLKAAGSVNRDTGDGSRLYSLLSKRSILPLDAPTTFDYNHDGMQDLIYFKEDDTNLYATKLTDSSLNVGKLQSVSDSFSNTTSFTYKTTKQAPVTEFYQTRFPYKNVANSAMVVDTMSFDSSALPLNSTVTTRYEYGGALYHMQGRGYLGFATRNVIDVNRSLKTEEVYNQAYPLTGTLQSSKTYDTSNGSKLVNQVDNVWGYKTASDLNAQIKVPFLSQSTVKEYAVPGLLTKTTQAVNTFDNFSNLLTRTQTVSDTSGIQLSQSLTAQYSHVTSSESYTTSKVDDWDIGFRRQLSVTSTMGDPANGGFSNTRTTNWSRYQSGSDDTNLVGTLTENGLITTFDYTDDGKLASKSITSAGSETHAVTTRTEFTNSNFLNGYLPQTITNATGHSATVEYDIKWHQPKKQTDVYGLTTSYDYDASGQLISTHGPDGSVNITTSQYCSNITCPTSAFYRTTVMQMHSAQKGFLAPPQYTYFDKLGRVVREETLNANNEAVYQDYTYDALSRIKKASLPYRPNAEIEELPKWVSYESYDSYDRPSLIKYDNGLQGQVTYTRAISNNQLQVTRKVTNVIPDKADETQTDITRYDALGQIAYVKNNESGLENFYSYDGQGNMRTVDVKNSGGLLKTVTATFNNAGFKTQINDPDTGVYNYEYDALGLMRKQSDARGNHYEFTYDVLNNQTLSKLNGQTDASWLYSESQPGLLLERFKDGFKESYKYDALLRTTQVDTRLKSLANRQFKYEYDKAGRLDTAHYPSGFSVQAQYNGLGYLTAYNNPKNNHSYWQAEAMDAFGNWVGERFGNNIQTAKSYDAASGLLKSIKSTKTSEGDIQDLAYQWDSNGNLRSREDISLSATETFSYDQTNRLKQATTTGLVSGTRTLNYGYDALGNLNFKSDLVSGSAHSSDNKLVYGDSSTGPSRLQNVIKDGTEILAYQYDANGNMTQRGVTNISYTAANKPSHIWQTIGANRTDSYFDYDPSEQRYYQAIEKNQQTTQEIYYYGAGYEEVFDTDPASGIKIHKQKAYVGGVMIHTYTQSDDPVLIAENKGGKFADIQYLHHDHLGSTQTISDATGSTEKLIHLAFDPFGKARQSNWENVGTAGGDDPNWNNIALNNTSTGFTGHEMLADFDLIHMGGRIYDPNVGRMMSADPYIQAPYFGQSFNRYSYVWNNPLSMTDPSGYTVCSTDNVICILGGDDDITTSTESNSGGGIGVSIEIGLVPGGETPYSNDYIDGSGLESDYAQNGGTSVGGATGVINNSSSYTDQNGSIHISAGFSIASISSGGNSAPAKPIEIISRLDSAQFAADLLATSEIPILSQVAGAANALTYAVRGQWGMAGSSLVGLVPGFGAGADIARMGMWASKGMGKAKDTLKTMGKTCCFVAGTLVLTSNGHANIEDLEVGDQVLAQNTATGELEYKPITERFVEKNRPIYEIKVVDAQGNITAMETTDDHPFYVLRDAQNPYVQTSATHGQQSLQTTPQEAGNWKLSKDLIAGDRIRSLLLESNKANAGEHSNVDKENPAQALHTHKQVTVLSAEFTGNYDLTFNLSVADFHTYFVTDQNVLVHNCDKKKAETLLPDSYWINKKTPNDAYMTPGVRMVTKDKPSKSGGTYKQTEHYDEYGRYMGRTDHSNHGRGNVNSKDYHPEIHHHRVDPKTGFGVKNPKTKDAGGWWPGRYGN